MSDNLREAKVRVAEFVRQFSKLRDTGGRVHSVHTDPNTEAATLLSADLDAILAAHPADTETEWGVGAKGASAGWAEDSEAEAYEVCRNIDRQVVSRQVTPWQVSK